MFSIFNRKCSVLESGILAKVEDRHSHILYGVDDGVRTEEDSALNMALGFPFRSMAGLERNHRGQKAMLASYSARGLGSAVSSMSFDGDIHLVRPVQAVRDPGCRDEGRLQASAGSS